MKNWRHLAMLAALFVAVPACGDGDEVRSGDGPSTTATERAQDGDPSGDAEEEPAPEETTTSAEPAAAAPTTSEMLAITGTVIIPEGTPGELSVVAVGSTDGAEDGGSVPVVIRNRTGKTLYGAEANATARGGDGSLAGSGSSQGFAPETIKPGEFAVGYVYFDSALPAGATFDVTATASDDGPSGSVDVRPVETNVTVSDGRSQVIGIVENPTDAPVIGPIDVIVVCFDEAGTTPTSTHSDYTDGEDIPVGGTASFSVDLFDDPCPNFVLGSSGYDW